MKLKYILTIAAAAAFLVPMSSCSDFLDQEPDKILSDDQIFNDPIMIQSTLANFYGRLEGKHWGQRTKDGDGSYSMTILDEAAKCDGGPDTRTEFEDDRWRTCDYEFIRNLNQFIQGVRTYTEVAESERTRYEAEARFLRAWVYFCMGRGLGGMPIVGDEVFSYEEGQDISAMQIPRSTEAERLLIISSNFREVGVTLPTEPHEQPSGQH